MFSRWFVRMMFFVCFGVSLKGLEISSLWSRCFLPETKSCPTDVFARFQSYMLFQPLLATNICNYELVRMHLNSIFHCFQYFYQNTESTTITLLHEKINPKN